MQAVKRKRTAPRTDAGAGAEKRTPYHHGKLRDALITRGIEILETEGLAALSIRRVARDLKVSPTAPLHHFANSAAYLAAIAAQGFRMLYEKRAEPLRIQRDPAKRLLKVMLAHLQFAVDHGALFQVMYGPDIPNKTLFPELEQAASRSYGVLESSVG
jgi:AcrR family transcriptional regulator